jgi:hypothetical protein
LKHARHSKYVPKNLKGAWDRAAADPELCGLRFELEALSVRTEQLLRRLEEPSPDWGVLEAALGTAKAAVDAKELEALQAALGELEARIAEGRKAALGDQAVWGELRQVFQERARVAVAENQRLVEAGLMLTKERALALVVAVQEAVRDAVTDPETFARGPQAVLTAIHRRLSLILHGPTGTDERGAGPGAIEQAGDGAGGKSHADGSGLSGEVAAGQDNG